MEIQGNRHTKTMFKISEAAMTTTLLLTFVKRKKEILLKKYLCIEIQTNLKQVCIFCISHKDRHPELRVFVMFVNALFKTKTFCL